MLPKPNKLPLPMNHLKSSFVSDGFVFEPGFQNSDQIEEIKKNLKRFVETIVPSLPSDQVFYEDKQDKGSLKQIQMLHEHDNFFFDLMTQGSFRKLAETLLGSEVTCVNMQYFNKPTGTGKPTPAHQDGYYFKLMPCEALTIWLALEPVDEENGCVRYVRQSHRHGMRHHGTTGTLGFSQGITDFPNESDILNEVGIPANTGDLLAHHALTIHRADANKSKTRSRKALGFIYYSANAKHDTKAWEKYQQELKIQLTEQGKI